MRTNYTNKTAIIISLAAFIALSAVFLLNPSETNIVKIGAGAAISKINLLAAPIVPCGLKKPLPPGIPNSYANPCTICHLYILTGNLINFVIYNIAIPLAALMFLVAAVYLIFSGGSEERIKTGRTIFQNTVIALMIVFVSWIVLTELFRYLVNPAVFTWQWYSAFPVCPTPK